MKTLLLWLGIALLAGCVGKPSRPSEFYVLSVEPPAGTPAASTTAGPAIGLGPVSLPELLDRPQIVTRSADNRVELAEYHRWGGELEPELVRVLAQDLMLRMGSERIAFYPWPVTQTLDYQVSVRVFRFDGDPGDGAVLEGVWRLSAGRRECEKAVQRFRIEQRTNGAGYAALVGAMSRAVGRLSDQIAAAVAASRPGCEVAQGSER
jgi:uncharacterized lipoprotein YmbA